MTDDTLVGASVANAAGPPAHVEATAGDGASVPVATASAAAAQEAAAGARVQYLSLVHSALGRPATVHMADGQARRVAALVAVDITAGGGGNLAVQGLTTPLGVLPTAALRGDDVVAVEIELHAAFVVPSAPA